MKASDNPFPKVILNEAATDGSDFSNPAADYRVLFLGEDGELHLKDSSGTVTDVSGAGGDVATDAIWDAAGDLAVGSGANTAARLAIGSAGGHLSVINSAVAWNSGTSFPANKATGDRYWRTDLGMEFYWDGTRWVTTTIYTATATAYDIGTYQPLSGNITAARLSLWSSDFEPYLMSMYGATYVNTTNDGTKYWTASIVGAVTNTTYGSFTTAADSPNTHTGHEATLNTAAGSTERSLVISLVKTSTAGTLYWGFNVTYRLIGT